MRRFILILIGLCLGACREDKGGDTESPVVVPIAQLQQQGCTVNKSAKKITIHCADNTEADLNVPGTAPSPYYIKTANGSEYPNLIYMDGTNYFNMATGHIMAFNALGDLLGIKKIYFEATNCGGHMYSDWGANGTLHFANQRYPNQSGAPGFVAFAYGTQSTGTVTLSYYQDGLCTNQTISTPTRLLAELQSVNMDSGIPAQLEVPITLMLAE